MVNSVSGGGAERAMNLLGNQLLNSGIEISLFAANDSPPDLVVPNFPIISGHRALKSGLSESIPMIRIFRQIVIANKFDWIILNCELPELLGIFAPLSAKLVLVEHNERPWLGRSMLGVLVRGILAARKAIKVSVSPHTPIWPKKRIPHFIIPNMVAMAPQVEVEDGSVLKRLVYIGRLTEQKNPLLFLKIVKQSGLSGIIIGDGTLRDEIEKIINRESLPCRVIGHHDDPWKSVLSGDLLVITSNSEGDGLVFIEAVNNHVPILVPRIPAFLRYSLPNNFYASNLQDYINRVSDVSEDLSKSQIGLTDSERILAARDPSVLTQMWLRVLKLN